jgi:hypothetical protein
MTRFMRTIYDLVLDGAGMPQSLSLTSRPHSCPEPVYDACTSSNVR